MIKPGTECKDGERKKLDCNRCFCGNGRWACTMMRCLSDIVKRGILLQFNTLSNSIQNAIATIFFCLKKKYFIWVLINFIIRKDYPKQQLSFLYVFN